MARRFKVGDIVALTDGHKGVVVLYDSGSRRYKIKIQNYSEKNRNRNWFYFREHLDGGYASKELYVWVTAHSLRSFQHVDDVDNWI